MIKTRFSTFILNLKAKARNFFQRDVYEMYIWENYGGKRMYGTRFVAHVFLFCLLSRSQCGQALRLAAQIFVKAYSTKSNS